MTIETESVLMPEWIDAHNAKVAAFRAEHFPRIEALTDEECGRVYSRWATPGVGMSADRLALEFRSELGMTWPDSEAVAIGMKLVHAVLVRLDKYDPDFRPAPEPQFITNLDDAALWYLPTSNRFRVDLEDRSAEFRATNDPKFGIDSADLETAYTVLEELQGVNANKVAGPLKTPGL
ncbi:hypothetical protein [Rhizobium sp. BK176]|uniref:hypothetical protein n=1 Tax=Rhizobium sp. BK176 TaxID=2587071 RepID=UPI002169B771|nr:hypothetical protein [Rhizobium sp. BK176]MCS4089227.1 hypothetical protein [Rhizobium sp. BK176]